MILLLIFIIVPLITNAQDKNNSNVKSIPPDTSKSKLHQNNSADTLNDYEIIYEVDTVRQTKTIIEHDTIIQVDPKKIKKDTIKPVVPKHDNVIIPVKPKSKKNEKQFFTALQLSPFVFTNHFTANDTSANKIIDYRKHNEKPQLSFSIAILPEYKFNKWSIRTGVQYSQLKNKYSYPYQSNKQTIYYKDTIYSKLQAYVVDSFYQVIGSGLNADTTWTTIYGHHWVTVYDSLAKTNTVKENQLKKGIQYCGFFEIPLIFGYEFFHYKELCFEAKAGIITSFLIYRKGEIVSINDNQTFINLSSYPFVHVSFSGYLGLNMNYEINKKISIEINPYYQMGLTSVLKKKSSINQSINRMGISFGLKYKF